MSPISLPPIHPDDTRAKLDTISALTWGELQGWHRLISGKGAIHRPPFDGEVAALMERARQLGKELT